MLSFLITSPRLPRQPRGLSCLECASASVFQLGLRPMNYGSGGLSGVAGWNLV